MNRSMLVCLLACLPLAEAVPATVPASSYAGQDTREIKALSQDEVDAYLAGKGMGLAKAAELNGLAGPSHVLELASQLDLTADQRARTEVLFAAMSAKARGLGEALVERERALDRQFAQKAVTPESLSRSLEEIGRLQAKVRGAHLEAHLAQAEILTPEQNARYATLRGYGGAPEATDDARQHMH